MRYLLLRNEVSVQDVADRAYKGLSVKARKQAVATLLKANPELKTFKSVRKGFIVRVPAVRDGGQKNSRNLVDPIEGIAHEMSEKLKLFENTLTSTFSTHEIRQKSIMEILKAANKELKTIPNGETVAKTLKKHTVNSMKINEKNRKLGLEALEKLQKIAADFDH